MKMNKKTCALVGLALLAASPMWADSTVAQVNGDGKSAVVKEKEGVQLVDIVAPGADGVSNNVYSQFNINEPGMVFKNSSQGMNTQLAGAIEGNSQLGATAAQLILNQVKGRKGSNLLGAAEIGGTAANLAISNPNGLTVNGLRFINTKSALLTTATPRFENAGAGTGTLQGFDQGRGNIKVQGLKAEGTPVTISGGSLQIDGAVTGQKLVLGSGRGAVTLTNGLEYTAGGDIDATAFGALKAGDVTLVGGNLINRGVMDGNKLTIDSKGQVRNLGGMIRGGDVNITAAGNVSNEGVNGRQQQNAAIISSRGDLTVKAGGDINNLGVERDPRHNTEAWESEQNAVIRADGNVTLQGAYLQNRDGRIAGADVTLLHGKTFDNRGIVAATGNMDIKGGDVNNYAEIEAGKTLNLQSTGTVWAGSEYDKNPTVEQHEDGSVTKTWVNSKTARFAGQDGLAVDARNVNLQAARVESEGDVTVDAKEGVHSEGIWIYSYDYANPRKLIAKAKRKGEALSLISGKNVNLTAGRELYLEGTRVNATDKLAVEGGSVTTDYSRTREASHSWVTGDSTLGLNLKRQYRVVGVDLEGTNGVSVKSTVGNVKLASAILGSEKGDVTIQSARDLITTAGENKNTDTTMSVSLKGSTFVNPQLTFGLRFAGDSATTGTRVVGDNVSAMAEGVVNLKGGPQMNAVHELVVQGANGVVVRAGSQKHTDYNGSVGVTAEVKYEDKQVKGIAAVDVNNEVKTETHRLDGKLTAGEVIDIRSDGKTRLENVEAKAEKVNISGSKVEIADRADETVNWKGGLHGKSTLGLGVKPGGSAILITAREDLDGQADSMLNVKTEHRGSNLSAKDLTIISTGTQASRSGVDIVGSKIKADHLAIEGGAGNVNIVSATNVDFTNGFTLGLRGGMGVALDPIELIKAGVATAAAAATQGAAGGTAVSTWMKAVKVDNPAFGLTIDTRNLIRTGQKGSLVEAGTAEITTSQDLNVQSSTLRADNLKGEVGKNFTVDSKKDHTAEVNVALSGDGSVDVSNLPEAPKAGNGTASADLFLRDTVRVSTVGEVVIGSGSEVNVQGRTELNAGRLTGDGRVNTAVFASGRKTEHDLYAGARGGVNFNVNRVDGTAQDGTPESHVAGEAKLGKLEVTGGAKFGHIDSVLNGVTLQAGRKDVRYLTDSVDQAEANHVKPAEEIKYTDITGFANKVIDLGKKISDSIKKKNAESAPVAAADSANGGN